MSYIRVHYVESGRKVYVWVRGGKWHQLDSQVLLLCAIKTVFVCTDMIVLFIIIQVGCLIWLVEQIWAIVTDTLLSTEGDWNGRLPGFTEGNSDWHIICVPTVWHNIPNLSPIGLFSAKQLINQNLDSQLGNLSNEKFNLESKIIDHQNHFHAFPLQVSSVIFQNTEFFWNNKC